MLSVNHYELIRRKHLIDVLSARAIGRELGHSRKTIRKALVLGVLAAEPRHLVAVHAHQPAGRTHSAALGAMRQHRPGVLIGQHAVE